MNLAQKTLIGLGAVTLGLALSAQPVHADERNQLSYLTFSQTIQLPTPSGKTVVLPAGTYAFRVSTGVLSDAQEVRVYDKQMKHLYTQVPTNETTFLATTNRDLKPHTILTFAKGPSNQPMTLVKWYYTDRNIGHEFAYNGRLERQLSEEKPVTVVAHPGTLNLNSPKGETYATNLH